MAVVKFLNILMCHYKNNRNYLSLMICIVGAILCSCSIFCEESTKKWSGEIFKKKCYSGDFRIRVSAANYIISQLTDDSIRKPEIESIVPMVVMALNDRHPLVRLQFSEVVEQNANKIDFSPAIETLIKNVEGQEMDAGSAGKALIQIGKPVIKQVEALDMNTLDEFARIQFEEILKIIGKATGD